MWNPEGMTHHAQHYWKKSAEETNDNAQGNCQKDAQMKPCRNRRGTKSSIPVNFICGLLIEHPWIHASISLTVPPIFRP